MDVVSGGTWRYPEARAEEVEGTWWVRLAGTPELVLPRGPLFHDEDPVDDGDHAYATTLPMPLEQTLHEVSVDLGQLCGADEASAASHLERHCQLYGAPDICGAHGLPVWHGYPERVPDRHGRRATNLRPSCPYGAFPGSDEVGIRVQAVINLVQFMDAVTQLADHISTKRIPARAWMAKEVLDYPVIPPVLRKRFSPSAQQTVSVSDSRHILRLAVDIAMTATGLTLTTQWQPQRRPELALAARTTTALYIADLHAHIGTNRADRSVVCSVCGMPTSSKRAPRAGDRVYCSRTECQRARNRLKQARFRAKEKANGKHR